jgi:hypothetical protein
MLVYILSNANQTLGVFSTLIEVQKCYFMLFNKSNIKLEEFTLNGTFGKDMTYFLKEKGADIQYDESSKDKDGHFDPYRIFEPIPFGDNIYECYNCGGEDCRDGCVNDNFSDF